MVFMSLSWNGGLLINWIRKINTCGVCMKMCTKCGEEKDESEFYKDKRRKSGLTRNCKKCVREYAKNNENGKYHREYYIKRKFEKQKQLEERNKIVHEFDIKPWKDPESLFCDTEFLESMLGKEVEKGKECKN